MHSCPVVSITSCLLHISECQMRFSLGCRQFAVLLLSVALLVVSPTNLRINSTSPTYCVDEETVKIFQSRYEHCMQNGDALQELAYLRTRSASDFQRSHELLAHLYFLDPNNPHRVPCEKANMEYIPLVPLSWRTGIPTSTLCTANGYCPPNLPSPDPKCSYKELIQDIVRFNEYITDIKKMQMSDGLPKFSVASTFNLRTSIGFGLPGTNRNGKVYDAVTNVVVNSYMGHYERHPQVETTLKMVYSTALQSKIFFIYFWVFLFLSFFFYSTSHPLPPPPPLSD